MKLKLKKLHVIVAAANAAAIAGSLLLSCIGGSLVKKQVYDTAARKWANGSKESYSQLSCFLADDAGFTTDTVNAVRSSMFEALKAVSIVPEGNAELLPNAYSARYGNVSLSSDINGKSDAELTVAGGNFFLFRGFNLESGSYFTDSDLSQDTVVIDRSLAWSLYGSANIQGKPVYINGSKFYISGVISDVSTKAEKKTAGDTRHAYISYEGVKLLSGGSAPSYQAGSPDTPPSSDSGEFKKVTCYECVSPDPVKNYAYNSLNKFFKGSYKNNYVLVNNTSRYNKSVRAKQIRKLSDYAIRNNTVTFPYWENASRIIEYKTTPLYFWSRLLLAIPIITLLWLLFLLWKFVNSKEKAVISAITEKINNIIYNAGQRKEQKKEKINNSNERNQQS